MIIYKITNLVNKKVYIGQTTKTLKERIDTYKKEYLWVKDARPIIKAMRKYGWDSFDFEIIEENIRTQKELDSKERHYITRVYKSMINDGHGYNVERGGNGKGKHTKETRRKIGLAQKGKLNHMYGKTGALNTTSKPVIELTTGMQYDSAMEASKKLKLNFSHICASARGTRGSTGGYVFRYINKNGKIIKPKKIARIKSLKIRNSVLKEYEMFI